LALSTKQQYGHRRGKDGPARGCPCPAARPRYVDVPLPHEDVVDDVDEAVGALEVGADEARGQQVPLYHGVRACAAERERE
jgi:hypothetical protein